MLWPCAAGDPSICLALCGLDGARSEFWIRLWHLRSAVGFRSLVKYTGAVSSTHENKKNKDYKRIQSSRFIMRPSRFTQYLGNILEDLSHLVECLTYFVDVLGHVSEYQMVLSVIAPRCGCAGNS